jgi:hypothetical protein
MITHLAGQPVMPRGRMLQRCLICGAKLVDSRILLVGDGETCPAREVFEPGMYVTIRGRNPAMYVERGFLRRVPNELCDTLVE